MHTSTLNCNDDTRREQVRPKTNLNGLDYLEVSDDQLKLEVYFLGKAPRHLTRDNFIIAGGQRVRNIRVLDIDVHTNPNPAMDDWVTLKLDRTGDFSTYTLRLVNAAGIDPFYEHIDFSFKTNCPSNLDCKPADPCPPKVRIEPAINYLAKDYASFRQLILDRLALIMPDWKERHVPDLGMTLVELLAYTGDQLSYYQDAVATEAYFDTARQRISVRRHARLVDYRMHEGCNARAWVCLSVIGGSVELDLNHVHFITQPNNPQLRNQSVLSDEELHSIPPNTYEVFEPMLRSKIALREAHNQIEFYAWGNRECCLLCGATSASLLDHWVYDSVSENDNDDYDEPNDNIDKGQDKDRDQKNSQMDVRSAQSKTKEPPFDASKLKRALDLHPGDVLIFEEVKGPRTGIPADADLTHRHAVRLTKVTAREDPVVEVVVKGVNKKQPVPVLDIEWSVEDALPFPLCLSAIGDAPQCKSIKGISVARGNVVLVDHGRTLNVEELGVVPCAFTQAECDCVSRPSDVTFLPRPFKPKLRKTSLTYAEPFPQPNVIAEQQARRLAEIIPAVRKRLNELWRKARGRRGKAVRRMLAELEKSLVSKARRVDILQARARAGVVLDEAASEITEMFGAPYAVGLSADSLYVLGPASHALLQDARQALPQIVELKNIPAAPATDCKSLAPLFHAADLIDIKELVPVLQDVSRPAAQVLRARLAHATLKRLDYLKKNDQMPGELESVVIHELKQLLTTWTAQPDLLQSGPDDLHFVVEVDNDGYGNLRFGNGELGEQPQAGSAFFARYRVGNGMRGNVGAEAISHLVFKDTTINEVDFSVRNPLPSQGGTEPEPMAEVKLFAPSAFRKELQRAITADDYAQLVRRDFNDQLQGAKGNLTWTGSWYEAQVAVDRRSSELVESQLLETIGNRLTQYRRVGHDVSVSPARYVPLRIILEVCTKHGYLTGHVKAALLAVFSNRVLPNGKLGFFHPDRLTFGEGIYLSQIIATAQAVEGVASVQVKQLKRFFEPENNELENGLLPLDRLEVARCDNDPNFLENGQIEIVVKDK